ncbi:MAG: hypothetical protein ABFQ64_02495 [Campylobacterota bacterium]
MNVAQYTFQSPYSSPVQVGRLDPSSVKEEEGASATSSQQSAPVVNETLSSAQNFEATQVSEVTPTVSSSNLLDVYA